MLLLSATAQLSSSATSYPCGVLDRHVEMYKVHSVVGISSIAGNVVSFCTSELFSILLLASTFALEEHPTHSSCGFKDEVTIITI